MIKLNHVSSTENKYGNFFNFKLKTYYSYKINCKLGTSILAIIVRRKKRNWKKISKFSQRMTITMLNPTKRK